MTAALTLLTPIYILIGLAVMNDRFDDWLEITQGKPEVCMVTAIVGTIALWPLVLIGFWWRHKQA